MVGHEIVIGSVGKGKTEQKIVPALKEWEGAAIVLDVKGELLRYTEKERKEKGAIVSFKLNNDGFFPIVTSIEKATVYFGLEGGDENIAAASKNLDALLNYFLINDSKYPILIVLDELQVLNRLSSLANLIKIGCSKKISVLIAIPASNLNVLNRLLEGIGYEKSEIDTILNNCKITKM